jgi:hypothetical protein
MAGNDEGLDEMYEYQQLLGRGGEECVVRGANIKCDQGTDTCILQLPQDHGVYTADSRPLINIQDKDRINISGFGKCRVTGKLCTPSLTPWTVKSENYITDDTEIGRLGYAVEVGDTATCYHGGSVSIITSGQTSPSFGETNLGEVIEIVENVEGSWSNKEKGHDFLGHISVSNYGLYNFGIDCKDGEVNGSSGSLFLYAKDNKKLKYMGAYEIKRRNFTKKAKIAGNIKLFNTWVEFILSPGHDYYIELDCPGINKISYWLVGNQEIETIGNSYSSGIWIFNDVIKKKEPYLYAHERSKRQETGGKGIPIVIMYLTRGYSIIIRALIGEKLLKKQDKTSDVANKSSLASLLIGALESAAPKTLSTLNLPLSFTGTTLSVMATLISFLPRPLLERLRGELDRLSSSYTKIFLYDTNPGTEIIVGDYYMQELKVEKHPEYENVVTDIFGEKYWLGEFKLLEKFDETPLLNASDSLRNILEDLDSNIDYGD